MLTTDIEKDIKKYGNTVYRIALSFLKNENDVEDIFQEVFIKLYKMQKDFNSEEYKKAWIIRVTINQCKSLLRKTWYKNRNELDDKVPAPQDEENYIFDVVNKLEEKYRTVIYLYYYEKYREKEIAQILGTNVGTVKTRLFRARKILKEKIQGGFENE